LGKALDFGRDVVGLDVQVDTTFVFHTLDLHDRFIGRCIQHAVVPAGPWMIGIYSAAQCLTPKVRGLIHVGRFAVHQYGTESGMVHVCPSSRRDSLAVSAW